MIMFFMLVVYWLVCIWYVIGVKELRNDDIKVILWLGLMKENLLDGEMELVEKYFSFCMCYLVFFYYVMILCIIVGFGNILVNMDGEMIFFIVCMLMGGKLVLFIF